MTDNELIATIYKINNDITSDCYIGSSVNYKRRKNRHLEQLKKGNHHSIKLQRAYLKYGKNAFSFIEIESFEFVSKEHLISREQFYLDSIKPVYNICPKAGTQLGAKRSDEFRRFCSNRVKGNIPWN